MFTASTTAQRRLIQQRLPVMIDTVTAGNHTKHIMAIRLLVRRGMITNGRTRREMTQEQWIVRVNTSLWTIIEESTSALVMIGEMAEMVER
ncbi:hypothetical protein SAMD00023353_5500310 [Rosellinia necatrix]|uniref:Uncharacterized protein n=1 Tax=Rosellinia necatrix TaxID=77044 RepID=A0A1S8AA48_ROSNE|nr:hypothetical protein SAMD00023353_5500310 [Rosellinia necatrix]